MNILVTGGAGFIASHIVDELIALGHDIIVIDNLSTGKQDCVNIKAKFYKCDITDIQNLKAIFRLEHPGIVIHHAAQTYVQTSINNPSFDADINIAGTINILECCREFHIKKVIYSSSAAVYGTPNYLPIDENHMIQPMSFYGLSKYTAEQYIKIYSNIYGIKHTIFRYSNVYGARQDFHGEGGVIAKFLDNVINNKTSFIFGDGYQTRDFIYVKDVVAANILALEKGDMQTLNISTNKSITINELYTVIQKTCKSNSNITYLEARDGDITHSRLDNRNSIEILDWSPIYTIESGIRDLLNS